MLKTKRNEIITRQYSLLSLSLMIHIMNILTKTWANRVQLVTKKTKVHNAAQMSINLFTPLIVLVCIVPYCVQWMYTLVPLHKCQNYLWYTSFRNNTAKMDKLVNRITQKSMIDLHYAWHEQKVLSLVLSSTVSCAAVLLLIAQSTWLMHLLALIPTLTQKHWLYFSPAHYCNKSNSNSSFRKRNSKYNIIRVATNLAAMYLIITKITRRCICKIADLTSLRSQYT